MDDFVKASASDDEFDPDQKLKVQELRERVSSMLTPEQEKDSFLMRWLIARNMDVDGAEDMLTKHIKFVKINGLDRITETYTPSEAAQYFHTAMLGYDEEGSVVRILNIGASDLIGLCSSLSKIECMRIAYYTLASDAIKQRNERINERICEKQVYIVDLQGLSWRAIIQRLVVSRAYVLLKNYEANHPERLKVAYIVNVPSFFSFVYNWLKSILPEAIISKLQVLSQEECNSVLTKHIDPSILPPSLGGCRQDPDNDPNCSSLYPMPLGIPVPENLRHTNSHDVLNNDPEAKKITVEAGSLFIAEKVVTEPKTTLQWDFQTVDYDIRMGLQYKQNEDSKTEEIIPSHRVESHLIPDSGQFTCEYAGIYEFIFDNTYSWLTRKELTFKIKALPPGEDIEN